MTTPNSTELHDRLTRLLEAKDAASDAITVYAAHQDGTEEQRAAHRAAMDAGRVVGAAEHDMRSAIRSAATVLDHVHACDRPTPADLVRQVARQNDEIVRLQRANANLRHALGASTAKAV